MPAIDFCEDVMRSTTLLLATLSIAALLLIGDAVPIAARTARLRSVYVPVYIGGASTVLICAPARERRRLATPDIVRTT
ncbi:hypothetical protein [Methylobacterium radiotolerans]